MALSDLAPIDPNTVDQDTLCLLPGIGPVLAQRIIAARPFETVEDLARVRGIGAPAIAGWIPLLALPSAAVQSLTSELDPTDGDGNLTEVKLVEAKVVPDEIVVEAESDKAQAPSDQAPEDETLSLPEVMPGAALERQLPAVTRGYVAWLVAISGLLALVLSLLLSLGILATLNGYQLQFASPAQISALSMRIEKLGTQADSLGEDLEGLRTRLGRLETMGERVSAIEQTAETLQNDVDAVAAEIADLSAQIGSMEDDLLTVSEQQDDLQTDVSTLQAQSGRFQTFLDGLQALMDALFQSEEGQ
jgi:chaperonin cofactor prefoldin